MVHPQADGDAQSFSGLTARFAEDDPSRYAGRTLVLWATASGSGTTLEDERTITVTGP
jgi:hypothetical protein